ncbi:MAG TPA: diaminopimelate decarboxylase [Solirubrobacteraceae bacterium]|nr:diaminopimelate decarboxylase [Solirubrobacteraceae bacterium]
MAATTQQLSHVYPIGSYLDERGRLRVGGCDVVELAREYGTPAYLVAEDDLRHRARAFRHAFERLHERSSLVFASKAFPATAVLRLFAEEGLGCDVASGGELALALRAGMPPERIHLHGNAKSEGELREALDAGIGDVVVDNLEDVEKLERLVGPGRTQPVQVRVTPDVAGDTHDAISTGQADSKFGFGLDDAREAIRRLRGSDRLELTGVHAHIGSQLLALEPFRLAVAAMATLGEFDVVNLGGGLGVAYHRAEVPPSVDDYAEAKVGAVHEHFGRDVTIMDELGRALVANACVTVYTVESVKHNVSTWVGVDGGMSDNLRPMLYGARYEAEIADRFGGGTHCHLAGKHCESGDVIVRDASLADPRPGDVVVTPATGGYGHSMANNYNGQPRPPVIFCSGGDARVVVRRETYEDLLARDRA